MRHLPRLSCRMPVKFRILAPSSLLLGRYHSCASSFCLQSFSNLDGFALPLLIRSTFDHSLIAATPVTCIQQCPTYALIAPELRSAGLPIKYLWLLCRKESMYLPARVYLCVWPWNISGAKSNVPRRQLACKETGMLDGWMQIRHLIRDSHYILKPLHWLMEKFNKQGIVQVECPSGMGSWSSFKPLVHHNKPANPPLPSSSHISTVTGYEAGKPIFM